VLLAQAGKGGDGPSGLPRAVFLMQDPQALIHYYLLLNIKQKNGKSQIIREAHPSGEEKSSSQPLLRKDYA
jgi:hypothetical protein